MIIKELEKLEKKQLDEADKIVTQFRERFEIQNFYRRL